jgi:hypothetical protein
MYAGQFVFSQIMGWGTGIDILIDLIKRTG